MSYRFSCDDNDSLIAYLYDEAEPALRQQIDEHVRSCHACAEELRALAAVRTGLASWTPPAIDLGITISRKADRVTKTPWWSTVPVWAQVAAAVFVFGVGLGVANIHVRSGADGLVVTTGWMTPASSAPNSDAASGQWQPALAALESRLRGELQIARTPAITTRGDAEVANAEIANHQVANQVIVKQVQAMLAASEQRQRQELALRLTQMTRDLDIQRRADLVRISQSLGQFAGRTGEVEARQRQMINYITRVSGQPQQ